MNFCGEIIACSRPTRLSFILSKNFPYIERMNILMCSEAEVKCFGAEGADDSTEDHVDCCGDERRGAKDEHFLEGP